MRTEVGSITAPIVAPNHLEATIDYRRLAEANRPSDLDGLAAAARDLAAQGLKPDDIARCLGLGVGAVRSLLSDCAYAYGAARGNEESES